MCDKWFSSREQELFHQSGHSHIISIVSGWCLSSRHYSSHCSCRAADVTRLPARVHVSICITAAGVSVLNWQISNNTNRHWQLIWLNTKMSLHYNEHLLTFCFFSCLTLAAWFSSFSQIWIILFTFITAELLQTIQLLQLWPLLLHCHWGRQKISFSLPSSLFPALFLLPS